MDNRFTRQAENALALAEDVVKDLNHGYIGTEHILVGLLAEKEGTAGKVLEEFHVEPKKLLDLIQKLIAPPAESRNVQIREKHYSPRAERVIQEADLLDAQVVRPGCIETTALGAAYLAGLATGFWKGSSEIQKNWNMEKIFSPSITEEKREQLLKTWKKAVSCVLGWAKE